MTILLGDELETPIGALAVVTDALGRLCAAEWSDHQDRLERALRLQFGAGGYRLRTTANLGGITAALAAYFRGELRAIDDLQVAARGTRFQRAVWDELRRIPCGETITYATLARRVGRPAAVRAVGHANGANPVSVVLPCHRVVGADGGLTGYGGGIERKRWLLAHEQSAGAR